jgi:predicted ribosome quality control (RQC) complex YloA/Tae2 family protein
MKSQIIRYDDIDYTVYIGKNASENWNLVENSDKEDLWFHLENQPSCHVILKTVGKDINKRIITICASLCKENSKYKNLSKISVIYSKIRDIKKGDKIGEIITKNSKTFKIVV